MIDIAAIEARLAIAPLECPECGSNDVAVASGDPRKVCADCDDIVGMELSPENADLAALVARVRELEAGAAREREARKTDLTPAQRATARARVKAFVAARDGLPVDLDAITEAFAAQVEEAHAERDEARARVRELETDLAKADEAIVAWQSFLRAEKSERYALLAIIEGRAVGPTNDELTAHDAAGGGWSFRPQGFTVSVTMGGPSYTHVWRERLSTQDHPARWWALDTSGRPCAWPVATGGSSE